MRQSQGPREILLVGSVPLASEREVFTMASRILGPALHALPDGETGERKNWTAWQLPRLARSQGLVLGEAGAGPYAMQPLSLAPGARPEDIRLVPLGYAQAALDSYRTFVELKAAGTIRPELLFQVSLPTPIALLIYFDPGIRSTVLPLLEAELFSDLREIVATVPHAQLAIQWDVAIEFAVLEPDFRCPSAT